MGDTLINSPTGHVWQGTITLALVWVLGCAPLTRSVSPEEPSERLAAIIARLHHPNKTVRRDAAFQLKRMLPAAGANAEKVVPELLAMLREVRPDYYRFRGAAEALYTLKVSRAVVPLLRALNDEDGDIANLSANMLRLFVVDGIARQDTANSLMTILASSDANPYARYIAAELLGHFRGPRIQRALVQALSETNEAIRLYAVLSLGDLNPKDANVVAKIQEIADRDVCGAVRQAASRTMSKIRGKSGDDRPVGDRPSPAE